MSRIIRRKKLVAVLGLFAVLATAGAAVAYFTATGSGTVTAGVGTSSVFTLHGTSASTLYPGSSSTVSFTVDNTSSAHQLLGTIHLASVKACVGSGSSWNGTMCTNSGTEATTCESVETGASDTNTANFWMADVPVAADFGPGTGQTVTPTGTLKMNDLSSNQNACENANLTLNLTS
jgi:hypothetical protein